MGTWGVGNFENDSALDWVDEFLECENKKILIKSAFKKAKGRKGLFKFGKESELEEDAASAVLVAGEVVVLLNKGNSKDAPEELLNWVNDTQLRLNKNIVKDALVAISYVKNNSELKDLWEESNDYQYWNEVVSELERRLELLI